MKKKLLSFAIVIIIFSFHLLEAVSKYRASAALINTFILH